MSNSSPKRITQLLGMTIIHKQGHLSKITELLGGSVHLYICILTSKQEQSDCSATLPSTWGHRSWHSKQKRMTEKANFVINEPSSKKRIKDKNA